MSGPKWSSSFYEGAAESAKREADEAAKACDFRGRAAQLGMAARDIAALESINADLLAALEGVIDLIGLAEVARDWRNDGLPKTADKIDALNAAARAAIAKAKGIEFQGEEK